MVPGVEADEGPGKGVLHQAGDRHRGQTGPRRGHHQPTGISKYDEALSSGYNYC